MSFRPTVRPRSGEARRCSAFVARVGARALDVEMGERADVVLARRDRGGAEIDHAFRREFARFDAAREIECGEQAVGTREHGRFPWLRTTP